MTNQKVIILFSGGIDSTLLAIDELTKGNNVILLHFEYDHPARFSERSSVYRIYEKLLEQYKNVNIITNVLPIIASTMYIGAGNIGSRIVANRNAIMLNMAINIAVYHGVSYILYGAVLNDQKEYIDCQPAFLDKMNTISLDWGVQIKAPYMQISKKDLMNKLDKFNLDIIKECSSCYEPYLIDNKWVRCNTCSSCSSNK